jgi:hypothetical protein
MAAHRPHVTLSRSFSRFVPTPYFYKAHTASYGYRTVSKMPSSVFMGFSKFYTNFSQKRRLTQSISPNPDSNSAKKARNIGLFLLLGGALVTSFFLYAKKNDSGQPVVFSSVKDAEWVKKCIARYPEILWLAHASTKDEEASVKGTYSEQLFSQKCNDFDRSITALLCLKLILDGSDNAYERFTAAQPAKNRLSRESFQMLHRQGLRLLKSKWGGMSTLQMAQAMETSLALRNLGKSQKARKVFKKFGVIATNHFDFYGEAMRELQKNPNLCSSFSRLNPSAKELLVKGANLTHYDSIAHLEGGAEMFTKLRESKMPIEDPLAIEFDRFLYHCIVAGAGHPSSLVYDEQTFLMLQAVGEAMRILANPRNTEWDAYEICLVRRASQLGLNLEKSSERVLTRIGAMLNLFTPEDGILLKKAMERLDPALRDRISAELDGHLEDPPVHSPIALSNVFINIFNKYSETSPEDRLYRVIDIGLPFITRVLEKHKKLLKTHDVDPNVSLDFNAIARAASLIPKLLLDKKFFIDRNGRVYL